MSKVTASPSHGIKMLQLEAFTSGNVVVSEDGHKATSATRKKAEAPVVMGQELREGITFDITLSGTGVLKMNVFSSKTAAKEWFVSGLHFPAGCKRVRNVETNHLVASVLHGHIEFTRFDQDRTVFSIAKPSDQCTLAFDIECGDVGINIEHLKLNGCPCLYEQESVFEDCSPYLQNIESAGGSCVKPMLPSPYSLCCAPELILLPGNTLKLFVTGTQALKDTGAYVRLWLLPPNHLYANCTSQPKGGKILHVLQSSSVEWELQVETDRIELYERSLNFLVDSIKVNVNKRKRKLAFEMYKVSLSVAQAGSTPITVASSSSTSSSEYCHQLAPPPPRPHHKSVRELSARDPATGKLYGDHRSKQRPIGNPYLTPVPLAQNVVLNRDSNGVTYVVDNNERIRPYTQSARSEHSYNERVNIRNGPKTSRRGQPNSMDDSSSNTGLYNRVTQPSPATSVYQRFEILTVPVQESSGHDMPSLEETEVKKILETDGSSLEDKMGDLPMVSCVPDENIKAAKNASMRDFIKHENCVWRNEPKNRVSEFNGNDVDHQTKVKYLD